MSAKNDLNKSAEKKTAPKRDAYTWIGVSMLVGMGLICSGGVIGGIALAITSFSVQPAMALGGFLLAGASSYIMPYIVDGINETLNPGSTARKYSDKKKTGLAT